MTKPTKNIAPEQREAFEAALERLHETFGTRTQVQLAEALGVRQSSISDAKRRCSIPDGWLVRAVQIWNVSPDWILHGEEPRYLVPSDELAEPVSRAAIEAEVRAELDRPRDTAEIIAELRERIPGVFISAGPPAAMAQMRKDAEDGLVADDAGVATTDAPQHEAVNVNADH